MLTNTELEIAKAAVKSSTVTAEARAQTLSSFARKLGDEIQANFAEDGPAFDSFTTEVGEGDPCTIYENAAGLKMRVREEKPGAADGKFIFSSIDGSLSLLVDCSHDKDLVLDLLTSLGYDVD